MFRAGLLGAFIVLKRLKKLVRDPAGASTYRGRISCPLRRLRVLDTLPWTQEGRSSPRHT